jgi:hypothetical protein
MQLLTTAFRTPTANGTTQLLAAGNYYLDTLEFCFINVTNTAAGTSSVIISFASGATNFWSWNTQFNAAGAGLSFFGGPVITVRPRIFLTRATALNEVIASIANLTNFTYDVNFYGAIMP